MRLKDVGDINLLLPLMLTEYGGSAETDMCEYTSSTPAQCHIENYSSTKCEILSVVGLHW